MRKLRARERKKKGTGENSSVSWTKSERGEREKKGSKEECEKYKLGSDLDWLP